jgi:hypothetical protein
VAKETAAFKTNGCTRRDRNAAREVQTRFVFEILVQRQICAYNAPISAVIDLIFLSSTCIRSMFGKNLKP